MTFYQYAVCFAILGFIAGAECYSVRSDYVFFPDVNLHYKFHTNTKSWYDAVTTCKKENATLAMPSNLQEMEILKEIYNEMPITRVLGIPIPDFVLLGFHDIFQEGEYVTLNGDSIQYHFHDWDNEQPNNFFDEDCGTMTRSGKLNDFNCGMPALFVCQRGQPIIDNNLNCITPDPAYEYSEHLGKCYKMHLNPKKWPVARTICEAEGSHLAIIRSQDEEAFLVKMFNDPHNPVYQDINHKKYALIGIHDLYKKNEYTTVLNEHIHELPYINWSTGKPGGKFPNENCGAIDKLGQINSFSCSTPAVFFCQQPAAPSEGGGLNIRFDKQDKNK